MPNVGVARRRRVRHSRTYAAGRPTASSESTNSRSRPGSTLIRIVIIPCAPPPALPRTPSSRYSGERAAERGERRAVPTIVRARRLIPIGIKARLRVVGCGCRSSSPGQYSAAHTMLRTGRGRMFRPRLALLRRQRALRFETVHFLLNNDSRRRSGRAHRAHTKTARPAAQWVLGKCSTWNTRASIAASGENHLSHSSRCCATKVSSLRCG